MTGLLLIAVWLLTSAAVLWWIAASGFRAEPAPAPADPHAAEVARFRTELHDWDRRGRP